jgi:hypothetical protein
MRKGLHKMYSKPLPRLTSGEQRLELPPNIALPASRATEARARGARGARGPRKVQGSFLSDGRRG